MKTKLIGIIICMLLVGTVLPASGTLILDTTTSSNMSGNTLYVGGDGPGNYSKIQDAINNASDGDTVFVYNGTYYEKLTIDKEITLLGEDKETTIIDGSGVAIFLIRILTDEVTISGFTIKNTQNTQYGGCGIAIESSKNYIHNNIISTSDKSDGIMIADIIPLNNIPSNIISNSDQVYGSSTGIREQTTGLMYNIITNNLFKNNYYGIYITYLGHFTNISNNVFRNNDNGIGCRGNNAILHGNLIDGCTYNGIWISGDYCIVSKNTISNQKTTALIRTFAGVNIYGSNNQIINNNFINNKRNAICETFPWVNKWDGNYWDNWIGFKYPQLDFIPYIHRFMFWFVIDWNPAKEPYDIS
jgi:parallel beta-helix repeat protein